MANPLQLLDAAVPGLGTAASVVGNVVGGIQQAEIAKKQQQDLNREKAFSDNMFNKEYYQDVLNRTENASMLRQLSNNQKQNRIKAQRTAAITGATPEATAVQEKNDGNIYADAVNRMAGLASQRKDMALNNYYNRRMGFYQKQDSVDNARKSAWGNFMQNAANLGVGALTGTTSNPLDNNLQNTDFTGTATTTQPNIDTISASKPGFTNKLQ